MPFSPRQSTQTWIGKRDYALLLTLYNTGARISEVLTLRQHHLAFGATSLLHLKGKGRKERSVPLWPTTSRTLRTWVTQCGDGGDRILFPSARGGPLSTDGANYILQQAVRRALPASPTLKSKPRGFLPTLFATPRRCTFFNPESKSQ